MSPSTSGGGASYYTPTGLGNADQTWQGLLGSLNTGFGNRNLDQYGQQSLWQGYNASGQYGPQYQNAANAAGEQYSGLSSFLNAMAQNNVGTQNSLLGAGQNVFNMGLDPQNALYDRTRQQVTDQSNAVNSMYGLGSSGAGAGLTNQALSNFNIDWQNNQLSRALSGLQGYGQAAGVAGRYGELAGQEAQQAPGYALMSGQIPYNTAQTIAGTPGNLANTYGSFLNQNVYGPGEGLMGSIIPYMNYGQGAQSVPFQSQAQGAGALGSAVSQGISGLGNAFQNAGGFGGLFGGGATGSFGGGDFSGAFASPVYYGGGGNSYGFTM
ncbi:hypothetical protein DF034_17395 [Burkholderia anthina]|uniref:hypothetical protein n=1 Tax=Burkholderia anthina TaxID=179879 RepID=UPI000F5F6B7A|nr:hypothetical protein [Burkholderia anthina]RQX81790.1 hypothetical protein DF034_17395 [Burkholderia anthina]